MKLTAMKRKWLLCLLATTGPALAQPQKIDLSAPPPPAVSNLSTTVVGAPGRTRYCYWVVANYPAGTVITQTPVCLTNAPDTLGVSNYVRVSFQDIGATNYDLLATATSAPPSVSCNCAVATASAAGTINDQGTRNAYTFGAAAQSASAKIALNNKDYGTPTIEMSGALNIGSAVQGANLPKSPACDGTDAFTQINTVIQALPATGGFIDATCLTGTQATTATLTIDRPVKLQLGRALFVSSQNPVVNITAAARATRIDGLTRADSEIRYSGAGAADIIRCGSPSATGISCSYVTISNLRLRPMESSVATVSFHAFNPLWVSLDKLWVLYSQCTGGLTDASPTQGSCGTGSQDTAQANIGAKFDVLAGSTNVPPAGAITIRDWLGQTGRGTDSGTGTCNGIWFSGISGQSIVNVTLDGAGDQEACHYGVRMDYVTNASIGAGWLIASSADVNTVGLRMRNTNSAAVYGSKFTSSSAHWDIDSSNSDIALWSPTVTAPTTLGTNASTRAITVAPCCGGGLFNLGTVPLTAGIFNAGTITGSLITAQNTTDTDGTHLASQLQLLDTTASSSERSIDFAFTHSRNGSSSTYLADISGVRQNSNTSWYGDLAFRVNATNSPAAALTSLTEVFRIKANGHIASLGTTAPALTSCGTSPTITGTDVKGTIVIGSAATSCTATFASAFASGNSCQVTARSGTAPAYSVSTTVLAITTGVASATYDYTCWQ